MEIYSYLDNVYKFLKDEKLCDIILIAGCDSKRIPAHRLILSATNDYFNASLMSPIEEHEKNEITINNITGDILQKVLDCLYTGSTDINDDNIEDLLSAASFLLCSQLQQRCTEYLTRPNVLTVANCLDIWMVASRYSFIDLQKQAAEIVLENFLQAVNFDEFHQLNVTEMLELLDNDGIVIDSEVDVFNALVKWIEFDVDGRKGAFLKLVQVIRLKELGEEFVRQQVLPFCERLGCKDAFVGIYDAKCSQVDKTNKSSVRNSSLSGFIVVGEESNKIGNIDPVPMPIQKYSIRSNEWIGLVRIPELASLKFYGLELVDRHLFLIGGCVRGNNMHFGSAVNRVLSIDLDTRDTKLLHPMHSPRKFPSTLKLDGSIYAIGGDGEDSVLLQSIERYDIDTGRWSLVPSMQIQRDSTAVTKLSGKVFVIGGNIGAFSENVVEYFDPLSHEWATAAPLIIKVHGARAGVINGQIYVLGGTTDDVPCDKIQKYDFQTNSWSVMHFNLDVPRQYFGLLIHREWAFLIGGNEDNSVEKINLQTGEKKSMAVLLNIGAGGKHILKAK